MKAITHIKDQKSMNIALPFILFSLIGCAAFYYLPTRLRKWIGVLFFVFGWTTVLMGSSIAMTNFDIGVSGIFLVALGSGLFYHSPNTP